MTRERRPVATRTLILGAILAVAAMGLAIVGAATFLAQRERVLADVDANLTLQRAALADVGDLRVVVENGANPSTTDAFADVSDYLRAAVGRLIPDSSEAALALIDGSVAFRTPSAFATTLAADAEFVADALHAAAAGDGIRPIRVGDSDVRYLATPVTAGDDPGEGVYVRAVNVSRELMPVTESVWTYSIVAAITLAAMGVVGWLVTGTLLSPLRRLRDAADQITLADLGARMPAEGVDDIADLGRTVNSMLDRLEGSVDVQRQLLDDVRHELKTPITIVRGHLETMDPANLAQVEATRELGISELDRMTRLVEDIDLLSSVEDGQFTLGPVDLGELTARMGDLVAAIPAHSWRLTQRGHGTIEADEDRVLQAWLQLADNAAKHTPRATEIEVGSELVGRTVYLWVRDHGPGIPAALRHRVFRRFDRAENHRTVGGSGLGLAIVDAIARAHGGTCTITDTPGGGATITMELPVSQSRLDEGLPTPVRAGAVVLQREASG